MSRFVHLRVHSEYSLQDSIIRLPELISSLREAGIPACALTDNNNLFAAVKFFKEAERGGIKPILGADVGVWDAREPARQDRLILLCQNRVGYERLCELLTRAWLEGQKGGRAGIEPEWLVERTEGLIALSGGLEGIVGRHLVAGHGGEASRLAQELGRQFPDRFYLEVSRLGRPEDETHVAEVVGLARSLSLPVVATNPVMFPARSDFDAHEVRVCIQDGRTLTDPRRAKRYTPEQYLKSPGEMAELFSDLPEALENTIEIARRCNSRLEFGKYYLPEFPVPEGTEVNAHMRERAAEGLRERLAHAGITDPAALTGYTERLDIETGVIERMGFGGYFLIVSDFIRWARDNGVPVGPGRGSGAGSLVAWSLGITELDPIQHELLFERFLNPERVSLPDFDIDFCQDRRDLVIDYVKKRYGHDRVAQIITYGTMAARAVVRDVGRALDQSYGYVDKLAKLIPFEIGMTLERALEIEPQLKERYDREEDVRALLDMARALEGLARNAGKHAGGVVIAPGPLTRFMPLYCEPGGTQAVTQLDKDDLEALGLVKFDFLGLRTLTIIEHAVRLINQTRMASGIDGLDITQLPMEDGPTYALLKACRTTACFQLESRGMKDLILRLQPDRFDDIVALVALFRPGPLQSGMVDDFIDRKHGRSASRYPHPVLETILKPTYGVILYQEQVMQIAQALSGFSLGRADLLRRAMGKKKPEEMAKIRSGFIDGAAERGVHGDVAGNIFDLIEKFAGYGFNRSHSAAYALVAWQTAWLKAHHPAAFMAAVLSSDMDKTDKVVTMIAECRDMKLEVLPPDINRCAFQFVPVDEGTLLYGLGAIKGIGEGAIELMLAARQAGPFRDLFDLCRRVDRRTINRRVLEALIKAGAMDALGPDRATLMQSMSVALRAAEQHGASVESGQVDLFGGGPSGGGSAADAGGESHSAHWVTTPPWSDEERLQAEKETLGLWLTGHPIARFEREIRRLVDAPICDLRPREDRTTIVAGLVVGLRTLQTKRGDRMAFVTLDDRTGRLEVAVFSDEFQKSRGLLAKDALIVVEGRVAVDEFSGGFKMSTENIYTLPDARRVFGHRLVVDIDASTAGSDPGAGFFEWLQRAPRGKVPVILQYRNAQAEADIAVGDDWCIDPGDTALDDLARLMGEDRVTLEFRRPVATEKSRSSYRKAPYRKEGVPA